MLILTVDLQASKVFPCKYLRRQFLNTANFHYAFCRFCCATS